MSDYIKTDPTIFAVPLTKADRSIAQKFSKGQGLSQQAERVYRNTLAVLAVRYYLQCLEIETDSEASDSWDPVMQTMADVADLDVKHWGKLECRPVSPSEESVYIPPEVWDDSIGCVAVAIDPSDPKAIREAKLLGFVPRPQQAIEDIPEELPISDFQPLDALIKAYHKQKVTPIQPRPTPLLVNLKQWFSGLCDQEWQPVELVLAVNTRSAAVATKPKVDSSSISRAKVIDLGMQLADRAVALVVRLTPTPTAEIDVRLRLYPAGNAIHLPRGLKLIVEDDTGNACMETEARNADNWIQLEFGALPGEKFAVKVALSDAEIVEHFTI
ncbi:MAG: DUF1822 family protein [Hormoscilla sp.]